MSVHCLEQSLRSLSNFELPSLEMLDGKRGREGLSLAGMLPLVHDIEEMRVCAPEDDVIEVLDAFRAVSIDIFDGFDVAK